MALVKDLPGLKDLTACYGDVTDAGLANLESAGELLALDLRGSREITGAGLAHFRRLSKLTRLCLAQTRVDDAALENLKGLSALEYLDLSDTDVAGPGLQNLREFSSLESLNLSNTKVTDRGLEFLSHVTQLKGVRLDSTGITDAGLVSLMRMGRLQGLGCAGTKVTKAGVKPLIERYPLMWVTIARGTQISADSYIQTTGSNPEADGNPAATADERDAIAMLNRRGSAVWWKGNGNVYSVVIARGIYPVALLPYLKRLPRLRELELSHATDSQIALVKDLPGLTSIRVPSGEVTDAGLTNLEGATDLQELDLFANRQITGAGLAHLRRLTKMMRLNLGCTMVDDAGLRNLTEMKLLVWLDVSQTKVTSRGLRYVPHVRNFQPANVQSTDVPGDSLHYIRTVRDFYGLDSDGNEPTEPGDKSSGDRSATRKIIVWDGDGILGADVVEEPVLNAADKGKGAKPSAKREGP